MKLNTLKCDYCGKFISYKDFNDGKAYRIMVTPDSHYSFEDYETICKNCNKE